MEENKENIIGGTLLEEEKVIGSPAMEPVEVPETETAGTPAAREKKKTSRRKKQQAPKATAAAVPRLKASLRHGFQLKGRYYSRAELGRRTMLEKLYKQYPGLFEK